MSDCTFRGIRGVPSECITMTSGLAEPPATATYWMLGLLIIGLGVLLVADYIHDTYNAKAQTNERYAATRHLGRQRQRHDSR